MNKTIRWLSLALLMFSCTRLTPDRVEVSGRKVEVVETGAGEVTVVFESGLGNDWVGWDEVASEVATRARVFAYSRPGYGGSEPSSSPRTASVIVEELRVLLALRGFAPPYVLVGHSFGGAYMELFARAHPEEVIGLVLVDARPRAFTKACEEAGLEGCSIPAAVVPSMSAVEQAEFHEFAGVGAELERAGAFGSYPVRVLTSGSHGGSAEFEALWSSMHRALADEATDGEQLLFPAAGHVLQKEKPRQVAAAILSLLP